MRLVRTVWVVAALAACSPEAPAVAPTVAPTVAPADAPAAAESPRDAPSPAAAPSPAVPPERLAAAEAFSRALERHVREGDADAVRAVWDAETIAIAVCAGVKGDPVKVRDFRAGLATGIGNSVATIVAAWQPQDPTFKRILPGEGEAVLARFRMVGDTGIAIVDLVLDPRDDGFRIVDFHNRSLGFSMVEQTRQSVGPILAQIDRSFLDRLVGAPGLSRADLETSGGMAKDLAAHDFAAVVAAWRKLPAALQDSAAATSMYLTALQQTGDETTYAAALERAAAKFPAPLFRFALVDVHYVRKDWAKAIACIDEFMAAVERDAAILTLRAGVQNAAGDVPGALATLREALALEPECVYVHSSGLDVLLAAKEWAAVRDSVVFLEGTGRFQFKGQMTGPLWEPFLAAPESEAWR